MADDDIELVDDDEQDEGEQPTVREDEVQFPFPPASPPGAGFYPAEAGPREREDIENEGWSEDLGQGEVAPPPEEVEAPPEGVEPPPDGGNGGAVPDPASMTVEEALSYAREHPGDVETLVAAEKAGKNRTTLVSGLQELAG
jgi:hypothetical protein